MAGAARIIKSKITFPLSRLLFHLFFLLMGIVICPQPSFANNEIIRRSESTGKNQEHNLDSLFKIALNIVYSAPDSARMIILNQIEQGPREDYPELARLLNLLGATYHIQADYKQALYYYYQALSKAINFNDSTRLADAYNNLGKVNLKIGNYKEAFDSFMKALDVYNKNQQYGNAASTHNNLGLLYHELNNSEKAVDNFRIALAGFEALGDSIGMSAALNNIGLTYSNDSALFYFNKAAEINKRNNLYGLGISYQARGNFYFNIGLTDEAGDNYEKARTVAQAIKQSYQEAFAILGLAHVALAENQLNDALNFANQALTIAREMDNKVLLNNAFEIISRIYEEMGDLRQSIEFYREYAQLKDELENQTILHQIYNTEISTLTETNALQQLQIEKHMLKQQQKNNLLVFIIVVFILGIFGFSLLYFNVRQRQQSRLQQTIINLNEKKSRVAIEAEIQERQRIGRELHDGLGQMLSVARLHISTIQQKENLTEYRKKELLEAAIRSVDEAFDEVRNISHNLAPSLLSEKGLVEAIKTLSNHINKSGQLNMHFETFGLNGSLDNLIEHTLYRAIQELLNNAIKHGKASSFNLQLIRDEAGITLMAEDNGVGFNYNEKDFNGNGGISNLRSRIENLNGTIFFDTMIDRGTIVSIVLPINPNNEL